MQNASQKQELAGRLTSNGGPEEDEGQAEGAILLLNLPGQHDKQQHVGQHMLEAGVNQDAGHPPVQIQKSHSGVESSAQQVAWKWWGSRLRGHAHWGKGMHGTQRVTAYALSGTFLMQQLAQDHDHCTCCKVAKSLIAMQHKSSMSDTHSRAEGQGKGQGLRAGQRAGHSKG